MPRLLKKHIYLLTAALFLATVSNAATYRAVASGNLSNSSTWQGGNIPPVYCVGDDIEIPNSVTLTLDRDLHLSSNAILEVTGNIVSGGKYYLAVISSALKGNGTIELDSFAADFNTVSYTFQGSITVHSMYCNPAVFYTNTSIQVREYLHLAGILDIKGGSFSLDSNAQVLVDGGSLIKSTGTLDLSNPHDIKFINGSTYTYDLTSGTGLRHVEVATNAGSTIQLGENTTINGVLRLTSGKLEIGNYSLVFAATGDLAAGGTGIVAGGTGSSITIGNTNGLSGILRFENGTNLSEFVINTGNVNTTIHTAGEVNILSKVDLQRGKLHLNGGMLSIKAGASITGVDSNRYIITGVGGRVEMLVFPLQHSFFPIGTTKGYTPVKVYLDSSGQQGLLRVGVQKGVRTTGLSGADMSTIQPVLPVTWVVEEVSSFSNNNYELEVWWRGTHEVNGFDRSRSYISEYRNGKWDNQTPAVANAAPDGMYLQKREAVRQPAYYALFDANTVNVSQQYLSNDKVSVYPNPANDMLYINYKGKNKRMATVSDMTGRAIRELQIAKGRQSINISSLQPGMYFLSVNDDIIKFIKH